MNTIKEKIQRTRKEMTPQEVEAHLKGLKSSTSKVGYLHDILERKRLLAPLTLASVYRVIGRHMEKREVIYRSSDMESYELLNYETWEQPYKDAAKIYEQKEEILQAAECYERAGGREDRSRDLTLIKKARDLYKHLGIEDKVEALTETIDEELEKNAREDEYLAEHTFWCAGGYVRRSHCRESVEYSMSRFKEALKRYTESQNQAKCSEIKKKIKILQRVITSSPNEKYNLIIEQMDEIQRNKGYPKEKST